MNIRIVWGRVGIVMLAGAALVVHSSAQTFTTLVNFDGTDGANPEYVSLVQGTDGNLYGTTSADGTNTYGTVFKVTPAGMVTTLHNFDGRDGAVPEAGLVVATDGNFYGTTSNGGRHHNGTIFRITPEGTLTTLHSFDATDGADPLGPLAQGADGNLYGTTSKDGSNGRGTIFAITPQGTLPRSCMVCEHAARGDPEDCTHISPTRRCRPIEVPIRGLNQRGCPAISRLEVVYRGQRALHNDLEDRAVALGPVPRCRPI